MKVKHLTAKKQKYFEVTGINDEVFWLNLDKIQYLDLTLNEIILSESTWVRVSDESMQELCEYILEDALT